MEALEPVGAPRTQVLDHVADCLTGGLGGAQPRQEPRSAVGACL